MSLTTPYAPLTTIYTLPSSLSSSCFSNLYDNPNVLAVLGPGASCLPPGPNSNMLDNSVYYSPAVVSRGTPACPANFTPACTRTFTTGNVTETAVTCCPRFQVSRLPMANLTCQPPELASYNPRFFGHYGCTMSMGEFAANYSLTVTDSDGISQVWKVYSKEGVDAHSVQVRWQSSDITPASTLPQTTSSNTAPRTSSATATLDAQQLPNGSDGLSTGAKIAIGLVIPLIVIAGLSFGFLVYRRRSRYRAVAGNPQQSDTAAEQQGKEAVLPPLEIEATGDKKYDQRYGLPARWYKCAP